MFQAIEEDLEEESTDEHLDYKKYSNYCIQQYGGTLKYSRPNNHHHNKFNSLKYNRSKSTISSLNRNNSLDSILETSNTSNGSCEKIYSSCTSINQISQDTTNVTTPSFDIVEDTMPSCSSIPVDDLVEPLTINEQLSINFNPNYDQTNTSEITTNPNPNENVKEYEIHLNPKFNLLKTSATTNSSHKLGKLLRNKSLDSILADSNTNSYDASRNIHRKSWCYGDEKTLSMIDSEQQANNSKKQSSCCTSVEKLNQSSRAFSSFEHINNLIEQAVRSVGNHVQESNKVTNERLVDDKPVLAKKDLAINESVKLVSKDAIQHNEIFKNTILIINRSEEMNTLVNALNVIKDFGGKSNLVQVNKLIENNEISIDYDEFSINIDEETNILNEFKHKKYSHHRLPSIESGFHDQIDSDSLVESNSESDTNYESLNQNNVLILDNNEADNGPIACELLVNSLSSNKHLEAINEHVKTDHAIKTFQNIYDTHSEIICRRNINIDSNKYDTNANIKTNLSNTHNDELSSNDARLYVTSEDVKNMCRNSSSSQNPTKPNRTSRILDKINSFNEKIESSHCITTNKTVSSQPHLNRNKSYPFIEENRGTVNNINNANILPKENLNNSTRNIERHERVTNELNKINEAQTCNNNNVTTMPNDIVNKFNDALTVSKKSSTDTIEVEIKANQSVRNKIKEFNSLRSAPNTEISNTTIPVVKKIVPTVLPINNRVTITKTIRKTSINNPESSMRTETTNTFNANKFGTLPKLRQPQSTRAFNITSDIHNLAQSLDYTINLTKHVNKNENHAEPLKTDQTVQSDTSSLVKKRKQMFELSSPKSEGALVKKTADEETTNTIRNRRSLFENFKCLNQSVSCNAGFYNGSSQGYYNGASRYEQDEDSDESGYVESQELETLQVNNNYVQV